MESQNWRAYNKAQCREKTLLMELLAKLCSGVEEPKYRFGRPRNSISDMIFCSTFKIYSAYSGRRFTSDMRIAHEKGYISRVPHYNSIFNYLKKEELTPILSNMIVETSRPLASVETDFAVDSSGFSTRVFDQWLHHKWSGTHKYKDYRKWVKAHLMVGVKTNIVTAAILTEGQGPDSPQFINLVQRTAQNFTIKEVSADKAYSSNKNMETVNGLGGTPYIVFKDNATNSPNASPTWSRMYHYFMTRREEFMKHYHKRSNVESTFYMIKTKFGSSVRSKTKTAQFNEVLCKILCHNICVLIREMHETGIVPFRYEI